MPAPLAAPNATPRTARGGRKRKGEKEKGGGGVARHGRAVTPTGCTKSLLILTQRVFKAPSAPADGKTEQAAWPRGDGKKHKGARKTGGEG